MPCDLPSLIESIFSSKDEKDVVYGLQGDDAQNFIDVIDQVRFTFTRLLKNQSITIGIDTFYQLGSWHAQPFAEDPRKVSQVVVQVMCPPRPSS